MNMAERREPGEAADDEQDDDQDDALEAFAAGRPTGYCHGLTPSIGVPVVPKKEEQSVTVTVMRHRPGIGTTVAGRYPMGTMVGGGPVEGLHASRGRPYGRTDRRTGRG